MALQNSLRRLSLSAGGSSQYLGSSVNSGMSTNLAGASNGSLLRPISTLQRSTVGSFAGGTTTTPGRSSASVAVVPRNVTVPLASFQPVTGSHQRLPTFTTVTNSPTVVSPPHSSHVITKSSRSGGRSIVGSNPLIGGSTPVVYGGIPGILTPALTIAKRFYDEKVLDHFKEPRNVGQLDKKKKSVGTALVGKASCGDVIKMSIEVNEDGTIQDAKFKTFGCGSAIASSSLATEMIIGKSVDEAEKLKNTDIASHLSLPPVKIHCSVLAEESIREAIKDYKRKNEEE